MNPFSIPNLPTDNLYKFYAISGIVLILFTLTFETIVLTSLDEKSHKISELININEIEFNYLKKDVESLENEMDLLKSETKDYSIVQDSSYDKNKSLDNKLDKLKTDSNYRDYQEFYYKYENKLIPEVEKLNELNELRKLYVKNNREFDLKRVELESKNEELIDNLSQFNKFFYFGLFLLFQGFYLSFIGFRNWKTKVQDLLDRKLEIELRLLENEEKKIIKE